MDNWDINSWEAYDTRLPIKEPPCRNCKYWSPQKEFYKSGVFSGIRCCWVEDQEKDFSCYRDK